MKTETAIILGMGVGFLTAAILITAASVSNQVNRKETPKTPPGPAGPPVKSEIETLKDDLQRFLANEQYEDAAKTRDKIAVHKKESTNRIN